MKKTTLYKLVKQALLEVLLEQRQTDNIQISPKTLLKLKEGLNPDEKQEIYTFLSNKTKKSTFTKVEIKKINNFLVKNSKQGIPLKEIADNPLIKKININGLGAIYNQIPSLTLKEFVELLPLLLEQNTDCSSFVHPNGEIGQKDYGTLTTREGSCTPQTHNDGFICCSSNNNNTGDTTQNPLYTINVSGWQSPLNIPGNQGICKDPSTLTNPNGSQFTFSDWEDWILIENGMGGVLNITSLCDPTLASLCIESGLASGCGGCAHDQATNYGTPATIPLGCDQNEDGNFSQSDLSCCEFPAGCGASQTVPPASNLSSGYTSTNGTNLTAVANETMPYWTDNGTCEFETICAQEEIIIGTDATGAPITHITTNYGGNALVIGGPPNFYDYEGIPNNDSPYHEDPLTSVDPSQCNITECANPALDPLGTNATLLASQADSNFVALAGTYGSGTSQYTVTAGTTCDLTGCTDATAANWADQSLFPNVTITSCASCCIPNITGCGTATTTANSTGTHWNNYNSGGTVTINDNSCYYVGCVDPSNNAAPNYICNIYPYMCDVSGPTGIADINLPEIQNASTAPFTHDQSMCCAPSDTPDCNGDCTGALIGTGVDGLGTDCNGECGGPAELDDCLFCHLLGLTNTTDEINACYGCMNDAASTYDINHTSDPNNECIFNSLCTTNYNSFNQPSLNYICQTNSDLCYASGGTPGTSGDGDGTFPCILADNTCTPDTDLGTWGTSTGCTYEVVGCMDDGSFNTTWGTVGPFVATTSPATGNNTGAATNYNAAATIECDGTNNNQGIANGPDSVAQTLTINPQGVCCSYNPGCTHPGYIESSNQYTQDDGATGAASSYCTTLKVEGCTNPGFGNYNNLANTDDGSCLYQGCVDTGLLNTPSSTSPWNNYVCVLSANQLNVTNAIDVTLGTTVISAGTANKPIWEWLGCNLNTVAGEFNTTYGTFQDNDISIYDSSTSPITDTYDSGATIPIVGDCVGFASGNTGCFNLGNPQYIQNDGLGNGAQSQLLVNAGPLWSSNFSVDDGSCEYFGCTDPTALNYFCADNPTLCNMSLNNGAGAINPLMGTLGPTSTEGYQCKFHESFDCNLNSGCTSAGFSGQGQYKGATALVDCQAECDKCTEVTAKQCWGDKVINYSCSGNLTYGSGLLIDNYGGVSGVPAQSQLPVTNFYSIGQVFRRKESLEVPKNPKIKSLQEQKLTDPRPSETSRWVNYEVTSITELYTTNNLRNLPSSKCGTAPESWDCCTQATCPEDIDDSNFSQMGEEYMNTNSYLTELVTLPNSKFCKERFDGSGQYANENQCKNSCEEKYTCQCCNINTGNAQSMVPNTNSLFGGCNAFNGVHHSNCQRMLQPNGSPTIPAIEDVCANIYIQGCTDITASNYDPLAIINDGSCEYEGADCQCCVLVENTITLSPITITNWCIGYLGYPFSNSTSAPCPYSLGQQVTSQVFEHQDFSANPTCEDNNTANPLGGTGFSGPYSVGDITMCTQHPSQPGGFTWDCSNDIIPGIPKIKPTDTDKSTNINTVEPKDLTILSKPTGSIEVPEKSTITPDTPEIKESKKLRKLLKKWKRNNL